MAAGAVAGGLGALLGIGGGVFLVPFLHVVIGLDLNMASGIGLMTVIATSSVVSAGSASKRLVNMRLGLLLQVPASVGALAAGYYVARMPDRVLYILFSLVTAVISGIMVSRRDLRNVILDADAVPDRFGGRFHEEESGRQVIYRTRRLPAAMAVSLAAGSVSGTLGIGGGILQVPAMNAWCGVPLRAAAATSAVMIGITAMASAPLYWSRGDIYAPVAAAAVIGVLMGSRAAIRFGGRARAKSLKLLMAIVLAAVSLSFVIKAL